MYVYSVSTERTAPRFAKAFAEGAGLPVLQDVDKYHGGGWAGFGSPATRNALWAARKNGDTWYYGDHGYFNRFQSYRISRNGFQVLSQDARVHPGRAPLPELNPWQHGGYHVLICPPDRKISEYMGFNHDAWLRDVMERLRANTDRPLRIRTKQDAKRSLTEDLIDCHAVVTWTSNAAVEAVIAGVPVFCTGDCAAREMGLSDPVNIEYPAYPRGRRRWLARLANSQWTLDEMRSGMAWRMLGNEAL